MDWCKFVLFVLTVTGVEVCCVAGEEKKKVVGSGVVRSPAAFDFATAETVNHADSTG